MHDRAMTAGAHALLLTVAEVAAGLIGLFLVGVIFYVESGFGRPRQRRRAVEKYIRSSTRIVLILYAIPLGLSLTILAFPEAWTLALFVALSIGLIAANVATFGEVRYAVAATGSRMLLWNEWVGTVGVALLVAVPFLGGGLHPESTDFVPAILLGLGLGFASTCVLVLTLFDVARMDRSGR